MKRSLLLFALCACAFGAHAEVYKWIDENGKVQYGDAPPKNAKAKVVSGGVTVVPATVIPTPPPAPPVKPEVAPNEGTRTGTANRQPDANPPAVPTPAPAPPPDPAVAARAEARRLAIERCRAGRGVDCENEVDAQPNGQPISPTVPGYLPGWSQPPIRPNRPANSEDKPRPPAKERTPVMPMKRLGAQSSSAGILPVR